MKYTTQSFRITGRHSLLGSVVTDPKVFTNYLASKCTNDEDRAAAMASLTQLPEGDDEAPIKPTGFYRHAEHGWPILKDYQIKGFLKAAASALADQTGLCQATSKVDKFVRVTAVDGGRDLVITRPITGEVVTEPDGYNERPLRATTMKGPRTSLAVSEEITDWSVEFVVQVIDNKGTAKSKPLTMDVIQECLEYGIINGLLQWRNAGYGAFTYEAISDAVEMG
jgi:hypothetical protein